MKRIVLMMAISLMIANVAMSQAKESSFYTGISVGAKSVPDKALIKKVTSNGDDIKFFNGTKQLYPSNPNTVPFATFGIYKSDSAYQKPGSYVSQYQFKNKPTNEFAKVAMDLGSPIKIYPIAIDLGAISGSKAMVTQTLYYQIVIVRDTTTLTSFTHTLAVQGTHTGDGYNGIGIYSVSGSTLTLISKTTNNIDLWKTGIAVITTTNLPTPQVLLPGKYAIMALFVGTGGVAPTMYGCSLGYGIEYVLRIPNATYTGAVSTAATYTDLPASIASSAFAPSSVNILIVGN